MISERYNNYATPAFQFSDNFPHMNQSGAPTWNMLNHSFSGDAEQYVGEPFMKKNFYEDEFRKMVLEMDKEELPQDEKMVDHFDELLQLSVIADEGFQNSELRLPPVTPVWNKPKPSRLSINSLLGWKRDQDEKHELVVAVVKKLEHQDMELFRSRQRHRKNSIVHVISARFGNECTGGYNFQQCVRINSKNVKRKRKIKHVHYEIGQVKDDKKFLCRHFAKGHCRRGENCDFQHDIVNSNPDTQKVFLGGLPQSITSLKLISELKRKGYKVINKPRVLRRYSPQVCLGSVEEARLMLHKGTIIIDGCTVDVRPYKASTQKEIDRQIDISKRSVFLGGLPSVKAEIRRIGLSH